MPRVANEHWISCARSSLFRSPLSPKSYWRASADVTYQQGTRLLHALEDVFTVVVGQESATELAEFAGAHRLSGYDAAYVMLAERQNAPLATLDRDMKKVAKTLGVSLFQGYTPDSV